MLGYKPTCTSQKGNPRLKPWLDRLLEAGYPYLFPSNILGDGYIFFRTEEARRDYIRMMEGVPINSTEYVRKLGRVLGFPPRAVEFFSDLWDLEERGNDVDLLRETEGISVNFSGFMFKGHIPYLLEDIQWLWRTYNHPEARKHPTILGEYSSRYEEISIDFGDYECLERICLQLANESAITI